MADSGRPTVIFHTPYPLSDEGAAASTIRPLAMRDAFSADYEVLEVTGRAAERSRAIARIRDMVKAGRRFEFAYSESSTMPTALTEPHHLPLRPSMDLGFLRFLRSNGIPVGLFYRDIYWKFDAYDEGIDPVRAAVARYFYRSDLRAYRKSVDILFVPTPQMLAYLPEDLGRSAVELPPASLQRGEAVRRPGPLSLLYVGGLGNTYHLHACVAGVAMASSARLTLCLRTDDWGGVRSDYEPLPAGVEVVHRSGSGLDELYAQADIGVLFMEPHEYWEFAAPMKLYEYLASGKPVIATEGTFAAGVVRETGAGWVIPYRAEALAELLDNLESDRHLVESASDRARIVGPQHTWAARAEQAAQLLGSVKAGERPPRGGPSGE